MEYSLQVLVEAIVVGLMLAIIGTIIGAAVPSYFRVPLPADCDKWNEKYIMQVTLFATGAIMHLACEFTGINRWYCQNGAACYYK